MKAQMLNCLSTSCFYAVNRLFRVFNILIVLLLLSSCIFSQNTAPTTDLSRNSVTKRSLPEQHVVQRGETLFSIAWRYGVDYRDVARLNNIGKGFLIFPNQVIKLKGKPVVASTTSSKTSSTVRKSSSSAAKSASTTLTKSPQKVKSVSRNSSASTSTSSTKTSRSEKKSASNRSVAVSKLSNQKIIWRWPSRGQVITNFSTKSNGSKGIDLRGKKGESVLAAASGRVVYAGSGLRGYGQLVIIKHNDTYLSAYAHNSRLRVNEGQVVKVGQHIADIGSSGSRTETTKLHFEIRRNGKPINPLPLLPKRKS